MQRFPNSAAGCLAYHSPAIPSVLSTEVFYNFGTPRGGQYQVVLCRPGSKSMVEHLLFATLHLYGYTESGFELSGEAYFEVAHLNGKMKKIYIYHSLKIINASGEAVVKWK